MYLLGLACNFGLNSVTTFCCYINSVAEGDSGDDDDDADADADIILENDCLASFYSQPMSSSNDTNFNRNSAAVTLLPQSISLPNSVGATLREGPTMMPNQNGNSVYASSSQGIRKDNNVLTL